MASDLLSIARSGAQAARIALDVTAQNIANAATTGYVRRSVALADVASRGASGAVADVSFSGVRLDHIVRNADAFRQSEVRRTGADAARAHAEVDGLTKGQAAIEQSGVYPAIVNFEAGLQQLATDPTNPSLRSVALENARTMAQSFGIAARSLDAGTKDLQAGASDGVAQVNTLASQLGTINLQLAHSSAANGDQSSLLDERDKILTSLSALSDITTTIAPNQTVTVQIGGAGGEALVSGNAAAPLALTAAADGTISFSLGGAAVTPSGGLLAGNALALTKLASTHSGLNAAASSLIAAANAAQTSGVALDGSAGQPLFSGSGAGDIAVSLTSASGLATAPGGSPAGSRNPANLTALRAAVASADPAGKTDALLLDISSAVQGRTTTRNALTAIADNAETALNAQAGVSLDAEAVNLQRYQQAFQASGRVMQVAAALFDSILQIR